ncbi:YchJ family protein [Parathalassolituus penaei]|uniref:YchJ family metal-binding protein n=1 Tax=Parathalassolituus penaei TaxID=2997323 RepID=A0A9X3ECR4_9GAMM|nr:YchJ family metal-binding protein [Parathalassolituus penaei]MCY0964255.1 YchJ family metal-binding protein [Parathalassolituus penaei]
MSLCPCGSGKPVAECCGPLLEGAAASSPEALMRSRYTAFVLEDQDYLRRSWHESTRPGGELLAHGTRWSGLQVLTSAVDGDHGTVQFVATYQEEGDKQWQQLQETSRFVQEGGHWFYVDGDARWQTLRPGRNDDCPCGSGRKFKKCCGA